MTNDITAPPAAPEHALTADKPKRRPRGGRRRRLVRERKYGRRLIAREPDGTICQPDEPAPELVIGAEISGLFAASHASPTALPGVAPLLSMPTVLEASDGPTERAQ